ncbi:hypothetical protein [Iodidimonas sp. SYSU 1G8]|uniref:hypothetical protein n=1 Tax=Iodidimonas sp. SYSU 1G8 TaxID=3133967 RepID=UPI0031FF41A4
MASETVHIQSPYGIDECVRRLRAVTDLRRRFRDGNPLIGTITEAGVRLRRRIAYRNSFQTYLFGTFSTDSGGTRLACRFGMHPLAVGFLIVWFTFVLIGVGIGFVVAFDLFGLDEQAGRPLWPAAIVPAFMALFAFGWLKLARKMAEEDEEFMVEFLRFTLDGSRLPPTAGPAA